MYALDTNTVIYFFKGMGNVATHLFNVPPREIAIPAVVLYELQVGIAKSNAPEKRRNQLNELLTVVSVLPFTAHETAITARIRAALEKAGTPIGPLDINDCEDCLSPSSHLGNTQHQRIFAH